MKLLLRSNPVYAIENVEWRDYENMCVHAYIHARPKFVYQKYSPQMSDAPPNYNKQNEVNKTQFETQVIYSIRNTHIRVGRQRKVGDVLQKLAYCLDSLSRSVKWIVLCELTRAPWRGGRAAPELPGVGGDRGDLSGGETLLWPQAGNQWCWLGGWAGELVERHGLDVRGKSRSKTRSEISLRIGLNKKIWSNSKWVVKYWQHWLSRHCTGPPNPWSLFHASGIGLCRR